MHETNVNRILAACRSAFNLNIESEVSLLSIDGPI